MPSLVRSQSLPRGPRSQRRHLAQPQYKGLYRRAFIEAFCKLEPQQTVRNPVMFVTWLGTITTFLLVIDPNCFGGVSQYESRSLNSWIFLALFLTVWFANMAEAIAEGHGKAQANALRATQTQTSVRRLLANEEVETVHPNELRKGDRILVSMGELIPADGEVIEGIASVDESAITGESAPVLKEVGSDVASSVTGGMRVISDQLTIRITAEPGKGFIDRMIHLVEGAKRSKTPNEIALTVLLAVLTQIFLIAIATLAPIANYIGSPAPIATLIALLVALIPTTIGGLLSAIGIAGMNRVAQFNVLATSGRAVETCGDINTLILDKTGTITIGNRLADSFIPLAGKSVQAVARVALVASYFDSTPEGKSIVRLAESQKVRAEIDWQTAAGIDFSARTRISGTDTADGQEFRKGAVDAIKSFAQSRGGMIPTDLASAFEQVSKLGGTPLAVCLGAEIYGVIYLKDIIKPGIHERFEELRRMGIRTVMLTGDNHLTAAVISAEAGVDDFIAEATPEDKIAVIQAEQHKGRLVAMTGDGTNDAPALAQADVGLAMNSGTQAAKEAANLIDLDSDPTKLIDVVKIGKQLLITQGALTTFSIANDVAKYFVILPTLFAKAGLSPLNLMGLATPQSALLAAMFYNALIIPALIPLALRGVHFKPLTADQLLRQNLLIYGLGGLIAPFIAIKGLDLIIGQIGIV